MPTINHNIKKTVTVNFITRPPGQALYGRYLTWSLAGQKVHTDILWLGTAGKCRPDISGISRTRAKKFVTNYLLYVNFMSQNLLLTQKVTVKCSSIMTFLYCRHKYYFKRENCHSGCFISIQPKYKRIFRVPLG